MRTTFILASLLTLAACGGGGSSSPGAPSEPAQHMQASKLVVIGNSISRHGQVSSIGWDHDSGMAASSAATDYAHLVAATLGVAQLTANNFADLERNPADAINTIDLDTPVAHQIANRAAEVTSDSIVVVQLSDNAPHESMATFGPGYSALLDAVSARKALVCVGSFWYDATKDAVLKTACEAHGGRYVYIGDIHTDPTNRDRLDGPQYTNAAVQDHPHDWSMARIAERVLIALER